MMPRPLCIDAPAHRAWKQVTVAIHLKRREPTQVVRIDSKVDLIIFIPHLSDFKNRL